MRSEWKKNCFYGHSCLLLEPFDAMKFKRFLDRKLLVNRIAVSRQRFLKYVYLHDDNSKKRQRQLKSFDKFCSFIYFAELPRLTHVMG